MAETFFNPFEIRRRTSDPSGVLDVFVEALLAPLNGPAWPELEKTERRSPSPTMAYTCPGLGVVGYAIGSEKSFTRNTDEINEHIFFALKILRGIVGDVPPNVLDDWCSEDGVAGAGADLRRLVPVELMDTATRRAQG